MHGYMNATANYYIVDPWPQTMNYHLGYPEKEN